MYIKWDHCCLGDSMLSTTFYQDQNFPLKEETTALQTTMQTRTFLANKFQIKHLRKFWSSNLWLYWTFLKNLGTPDDDDDDDDDDDYDDDDDDDDDMTWLIIHVDFWRICKMWNRTTDCSASLHTAHHGTKLLV